MTPSATAPHRRRQFCTKCGHIHRKNAHCVEEPDDAQQESQLCQLSGVPNIRPYPDTAVNLARTARELEDNAVIKRMNGKPESAAACLKLATRRLHEAARLQPQCAAAYEDQARLIEEETKS